jgi:hypothetical protein
MDKRKLTDKQIIDIANTYASNNDSVTVLSISDSYLVSTTTISKALHYAISSSLVNERVANLIAEKAIRHDNIRRERFGYAKSKKVANLYKNLILLRKQKTDYVAESKHLESKYSEIKNQYDTFDETISSSDEFPYTKEELKEEMDSIQEQIQKLKGQ